MKIAMGWLAAGLVLGLYGLSLLNQCGPCTIHLGFGGLGLIGAGGACGVGSIAKLIAVSRTWHD